MDKNGVDKISIKYLASDLKAVRDQTKNRRKNCVNEVLKRLGYTRSESISIKQFDALLIRAIDQNFGGSRDADILLMAFGLMQGYRYEEITSIGARRKKYLAESNYLVTHPRKQILYADATKEQKDKLEDKLRKAEDGRIESLAFFLSQQDIPKYINDNIASITIPKPSYVLLEDEPTSADGEDDAADSEVPCSDTVPTDDNIPEKIDEDTTPLPKDAPATAEGQRDSRSREEPQSDTSNPTSNFKGFRIHMGNISIGHLYL